MLLLVDTGKACACCLLKVLVSALGVNNKQRDQDVVDFRHVKQVKDFFQISQQLFVLTPPAAAALQVSDESLKALKQVRVDDLLLVIGSGEDREEAYRVIVSHLQNQSLLVDLHCLSSLNLLA